MPPVSRFAVAHLDDLEAVPGPGTLTWRADMRNDAALVGLRDALWPGRRAGSFIWGRAEGAGRWGATACGCPELWSYDDYKSGQRWRAGECGALWALLPLPQP